MRLNITNMSCGHCSAAIEKAIASVDPAAEVKVDIPSRTVDVDTRLDAKTLVGAIRAEGYDAQLS